MDKSRIRTRSKRYIKQLIHNFRFTYEDISKSSNIEVNRLKAINKKEEPTFEEYITLKKVAIELSRERGEDSAD
jgi:galactokinase/mevalonate kinase-like predicted kinase